MKDKKLITRQNDKIVEYEIIIEFKSNKNNKEYIAYTDNSRDELNNLRVYISSYEKDSKDNDLYILNPITDKEEIKMINNILNDIKES